MKQYKITENNITYDIYESDNGNKHWYLNGKLHRDGGPAVEYPSGYKEYVYNGKTHRENGPAIEHSDGSLYYWYNDQYIESVHSDEELKRYIKLLSIS